MVRAITAVVLGIAIVAAVWWMPANSLKVLLFVILLLGAFEFGRMFFPDRVERGVSIAAIVVVAVAMFYYRETARHMPVILAILLFALMLVFMWRAGEISGVAERIGLCVLGIFYLGIAFPFWIVLRDMENGNSVVLFALIPACLCDTFAYITGKLFGRHKFAPRVSPNKTVEGFVGALFGSIVGTVVIWRLLLPDIFWAYIPGFAVMIWITSPFGDLVESMLKRSCGVKDSGGMIPGHGGVLDRLDALIFTGPAAFVYMKYIVGF